MNCTNSTGGDLKCVVTSGSDAYGIPTTNVSINASSYCPSTGCTSGQQLTLVLNNAKNPGYINSPLTRSVQIYSLNLLNGQLFVIAQAISGVFFANSLVSGTFPIASMQRTGSSLTGALSNYQFTFMTTTTLMRGAFLSVTFPPSVGFVDSSTLITCQIGSINTTCNYTTSGGQVDQVLVNNLC
jgi:hypothetical protein